MAKNHNAVSRYIIGNDKNKLINYETKLQEPRGLKYMIKYNLIIKYI